MTGRTLTRGQTLALTLDRNLAVTAGAGTGKTLVLTERYIRLLEDRDRRLSPTDLLAVTFTRKAAAEMRDRITKKIRERIHQARDTGDSDGYAFWTRHRRALASATITTIHGLAATIVRDHALDAGIDADFQILEGPAQEDLIGDTIRLTLRATTDDLRRTLARLLVGRSSRALHDILHHLLKDRTFARRWRDTLERHDDATLLDTCTRLLLPFDEAAADTALATITEIARRVDTYPRAPDHPTTEALFDRLRRSSDADRDLAAKAHALHALWDHITTKDGTYYKARHGALGPKATWKHLGDPDGGNDILDRLEPLFDTLLGGRPFPAIPGDHDVAMLSEARAIAALFDAALARYEAAKRRRGVLDQHDLLETAARLMARDWIARPLRERWRHLMVDEFQDTDPLQWEMVRALAIDDAAMDARAEPGRWQTALELEGAQALLDADDAGPPEDPLLARDRLFIVGDEKQSIYSFRGADVTVYQDSRDAIREANRRHAPHLAAFAAAATPEETLGLVALDTNFRSVPTLVHFANTFFDHLLRPENLVQRRDEAAPAPLTPHRAGEGSIRLILTPADPEAMAEAGHIDTSLRHLGAEEYAWRTLAERIVKDVDGPDPLKVHTTDGWRDATYDDIVILLARHTKTHDLVRILREHAIPHTVAGGRGFWDRQEVWDLVSLLATLSDPRRDIPLVAILRSPLFAWTDAALVRLRQVPLPHESRNMRAWARLREAARQGRDLGGPDHAPVPPAQVVHLLERLRARIGRESSAAVLEEALDDTGYLAALGAERRHEQAVHNVEKALDIIRDIEARHGIHPGRTTRLLEDIIERGTGEGEATVPMGRGHGVRILTIHSAKGLQFPIVYIPELHRDLQYGHLPKGFRGGRLGDLTLLATKTRGDDGDLHDTAISQALAREEVRHGRAEAKRLLYVAMTRAEDHLVLVGTSARSVPADHKDADTRAPPVAQGGRWGDWLEHIVGIGPADLRPDAGPAVEERAFGTARFILDRTPPRVVPTLARSRPVATTPPTLRPLPPVGPKRLVVIAPSAAEVHAQCPARFRYRYLDGMAENRARRATRRQQDHATLIGDLVHQALESGARPDKPLPEAVMRRARRRARALGRDPETTVAAIARHVQSALGRLDDTPALHEIPIDLQLHRTIRIRGRIDRLQRDAHGWVVTDYKTDDTDTPERTADTLGHAVQAGIYGRAVGGRSRLLYTGTGSVVELQGSSRLTHLLDLVVQAQEADEEARSGLFPPRPDRSTCGGCGFAARRGGPCPGWAE